MNETQKDIVTYGATAIAGGFLAKSFGAQVLGIAIGGVGGIAVAAFIIMNKHRLLVTGEPRQPYLLGCGQDDT